MTVLYGARYSVVLLRPKHKVKLRTPQSAEKWICMEKWAFDILAECFSKTRRPQTTGPFYPVGAVPNS